MARIIREVDHFSVPNVICEIYFRVDHIKRTSDIFDKLGNIVYLVS